MTIKGKRPRCAEAVTLIEVMVAMAVLAIAALGALGYQYYAASQSWIAKAQTTATRTAQLLLEDWKSTGGSSDYDPTALGLGFSSDLPLLDAQSILLPRGVYDITVDDVPMVVVLNSADVASDSKAQVTLRQLTVTVLWRENLSKEVSREDIISSKASGTVADKVDNMRRLVTLTTYVRVDASGG